MDEPLKVVALCGGVALYLLGHRPSLIAYQAIHFRGARGRVRAALHAE